MNASGALRRIDAASATRMRWRNDGSWTTELARAGAADLDGDAFRWRVSIAEIETDGPFSRFPGVDRELLLLAGAGMALQLDGAPPQRLEQRFAALRFPGEAAVACRLLDGPTRDFNVMARRGYVTAQTWARPLLDSMVLVPEPGAEWFVHVLSGQATARAGPEDASLATGDSLLVDWRETAGARVLLRGGAELVLVRFRPA